MNVIEIDKQYIAGTYARFPVQIVSGKGSRVTDVDGKEYIKQISEFSRDVDVHALESREGYKLRLGHIIDLQTNEVVVDLRQNSVYDNYGLFVFVTIPLVLWSSLTKRKKKKQKTNYTLYERIDPSDGKGRAVASEDGSFSN